MNRFLAAVVTLMIVAAGADASAESETLSGSAMANRYESPQDFIKRILESDSTDNPLEAIARYVKPGDSMDGVEKRLGEPARRFLDNSSRCVFTYRSGLTVFFHCQKVTAIFYRTRGHMFRLD